jgi:imidazolonepropionase
MHLACVNQRMSLSEAMAGATINSAHSIGRSKTHGSIEKGKVADMVVVDAPR